MNHRFMHERRVSSPMCQSLIASLRRRIQLCGEGAIDAVTEPRAIAEANELTRLIYSPSSGSSSSSGSEGEENWYAEALSAVIDFSLCLSRVLPGSDSAEYYKFAVRQMMPLLRIDPERVNRVFWSQIRLAAAEDVEAASDDDSAIASDSTRERLVLLEWFIEHDKSEGKADHETLSLVARALRRRFEVVSDQAIAAARQSTSALPRSDPAAGERWSQLARIEHRRFSVTGDIGFLNAAIKDMRVPLRHQEEPDPALEEDLALWQVERYQLLGDPDDIRDAARSLVRLSQGNHHARPDLMFNALATSLTAAELPLEALRNIVSMCAAMTTREPAPASGSTAGPEAWCWYNLASKAICALPEEARTEQDLELAIRCAGIAAATGDTVRHPGLVPDLVTALTLRGWPADLDMAVRELQSVLGRSPDWEREFVLLATLGTTHLRRYELTGADPDQLDGIDALRRVAMSGDCQARLRGDAAYLWAKEALKRGDYTHACDAFEVTTQLIAEQVRRSVRPEERSSWLKRWAASARDGAACAIRAGRPGTALTLLEQGRAVSMSRSLQLQADIAAVQLSRPDLAERMTQLARRIDGFVKGDQAERFTDYLEAVHQLWRDPADPEPPTDWELNNPGWFLEDYSHAKKWSEELIDEITSNDSRITLGVQWDQLMDVLRWELPELPVCAPPAIETLLSAVSGGAGVVVNVSAIGCDALIISGGGLSVLPLTDLTEAAVREAFARLIMSIFRIEAGDRSAGARANLRTVMLECLAWLWDTVCAPVLTALGIDGPPSAGQEWPRIWWCPSGHLAMFPMHAAGRFGPDGQGPCVIDRVISSYTTTLAALARARDAAAASPNPSRRRRLLAISVPEKPGASVLRHTDQELAAVSPWVPEDSPALVGDRATVENVYRFRDFDWLHVACHGTAPIPGQQPALLFLSNSDLSVNRLIWEQTANAELAFLSGCHTALGSFETPDEAEHLAGAFQATGYQHVIGTLWGAADHVAAQVATDFYGALAADQAGQEARQPRVAEALHQAVRACKDAHPRQPFLWAPFVHLGP